MAAEYGININVRTRTQALKKLQTDLEAVNQEYAEIQDKIRNDNKLKDLNKQKNRALADEVDKLRNAVIVLNNGFVNNTNRITDSAKTLRLFSRELNDARKNTKLFGSEYKVLTQGIEKANFTARFKDLKEFNKKAAITAGNLGGDIPMARGTSFEDLMSFRPTQTRKAINQYLGFLKDLEARLDRTSDRFKEVTQRIREMERELNSPVIANPNAYSSPTATQPRRALAGENFFNRTLGRNRQFQRGGMFYEPGGFAKRRRNAVSSGLIGGAFPLLFGQGLGASVGGGVGGVAGGALGGGLGFGLSLVGTQLGATFDKLTQSAIALGKALRNPIENVELLIQKVGQANTPFGDTVKTLNDLGLQGIAAEKVLDKFNKTFGTNKTTLVDLGKEAIQFQNELEKLGTGMSLFVSGPLTSFLSTLNDALGFTSMKTVNRRTREAAYNQALQAFFPGTDMTVYNTASNQVKLKTRGMKVDGMNFREYRKSLEPGLFPKVANEAGLGGQESSVFGFAPDFHQANMQRLIKERRDFELSTMKGDLDIQQKSLTLRSQDLDVLRKRMDLLKIEEKLKVKNLVNTEIMTTEQKNAHQFEIDKLEIQKDISEELLNQSMIMADPMKAALVGLNKEMAQLNDAGYRLVEVSKAISNGFSESFKGIVNGTMTAQQALANFFQKVADSFLDMAAQMIAKQIQMKILGIGLNWFGGGSSSFFVPNESLGISDPNKYLGGPNPFKAEGGPVSGGRSYIVGEKGPEVFTPGISGGITPNHALGGSTNISVSVDASGTSVQGDEPNGEELGRLVAAAIQSELIKEKRPGGLLS